MTMSSPRLTVVKLAYTVHINTVHINTVHINTVHINTEQVTICRVSYFEVFFEPRDDLWSSLASSRFPGRLQLSAISMQVCLTLVSNWCGQVGNR